MSVSYILTQLNDNGLDHAPLLRQEWQAHWDAYCLWFEELDPELAYRIGQTLDKAEQVLNWFS